MQQIGNAIIKDTEIGWEIEIPFPKYWKEIIFYSSLLLILTLMIITSLTLMIGIIFKLNFMQGITLSGILFILLFNIVAILMGIKLLKDLLWGIHGKELIIIDDKNIIIDRTGTIFKRRVYPLTTIKKFTVIGLERRTRYNMDYNFGRRGVFKLEYGKKTVKFGSGINEEEGKEILDVIKSKQTLNETLPQ